MKRLTSNKSVSEMGMVELAYNSCFVKDGAAWYRDYSVEVDARTLARKLLKDFAEGDDSFTCDEDFDEYISACLEDGTDSIEGLIALFYRNLWAMAGLYAHLKHYEDLEEQGKLLKLPCAVGDTVYEVQKLRKRIQPYIVIAIHISNSGNLYGWELKDGKGVYSTVNGFSEYDIGKTVFLTQEEADAALKELKEG